MREIRHNNNATRQVYHLHLVSNNIHGRSVEMCTQQCTRLRYLYPHVSDCAFAVPNEVPAIVEWI